MKDYQFEMASNQWGINKCIHNAWVIAEPLLECVFNSPMELYTTLSSCLPFCVDYEVSVLLATLDDDGQLLKNKPNELDEFLWGVLRADEGEDFEIILRIRVYLLIFMLELHNANYHKESNLEYRAYFSFGEAMMASGEARACFRIDSEERRRSNFAKSGAHGKLKNDPKQAAKMDVRDCWNVWKKKPTQFKSKSAFARSMLDKYESLESQRVIERWCKEWESEPSQQSTYSAS